MKSDVPNIECPTKRIMKKQPLQALSSQEDCLLRKIVFSGRRKLVNYLEAIQTLQRVYAFLVF